MSAHREKKEKEAEELADKADEILQRIISKDARERMTYIEANEPATAEQVKDQLLADRNHWMLNGPVSDDQLKAIIEKITKANTAAKDGPDVSSSRGVVLDRRRLAEDSDDSDVSLSGL